MIQSSRHQKHGVPDTPLSRGMTSSVLREGADVNEKMSQLAVRDVDWADQHWKLAAAPLRVRNTRA
jgi:hypothetical protein